MPVSVEVSYVDDDSSHLEFVQSLLDLEGYPVNTFNKGQDYLESNNQYEKVLICDREMPGLGGVEVIEQRLQIKPHLSVIVLSAGLRNPRALDEFFCMEARVRKGSPETPPFEYEEKPYDIDHLVQKVIGALKHYPQVFIH